MAYWLDRLPPQPVLDGLEKFNVLTSQLPKLNFPLATLPTFDPTAICSITECPYGIRDFMEEFAQ